MSMCSAHKDWCQSSCVPSLSSNSSRHSPTDKFSNNLSPRQGKWETSGAWMCGIPWSDMDLTDMALQAFERTAELQLKCHCEPVNYRKYFSESNILPVTLQDLPFLTLQHIREGEEKERETETEPRHITSHTTHAPPFPSAFGCVLDDSWTNC